MRLLSLPARRPAGAWTGRGSWRATPALPPACTDGAPCPGRLDGSGARVAELADELLASAVEPLEVIRERQAEELATLRDEAEQRGEKAIPHRSAVEDRHRREQRRVRTDELRAGLASLSSVYRQRLSEPDASPQRLTTTLSAISAIDEAGARLTRNVNETMLLQWLLLRLDT